MFSSVVQPGLVSLFSSTGSDPLTLWSTYTDPSLPEDSFICLLNDSTSLPSPPPPATLAAPHPVKPDAEDDTQKAGYALGQTVLHVQSPSLRTTYVRSPPARAGGLGLKHPWLHIQMRNMGREWAFELGVVDASGRAGVVRCSTFQKSPALKRTTPPLLHLPLAFPTAASTPLTAWCTLAIHLPSLLPHFSSRSLLQSDDEEEEGGSSAQMPGAKYGHVSYVKIYATCRLRRVWFSETARNGSQKTPWEFLLYAADV